MSKRTPTLIIGGLVAAVVIFTVVLWSAQKMAEPAVVSADDLAVIPLGGKVGVVAQITAIEGSTLTIQVLQGKDYSERTHMLLQVQRGKDFLAMGSESDVKVGAIARFDAVKTGVNALRLNQMTILTGMYKGPPPN